MSEVLKILTDMKAEQARQGEELRGYIRASTERREVCGKRFDDQEKRLRELETVSDQAKGGWKVIAAMTAAAGVIGGVVAKLLSHVQTK